MKIVDSNNFNKTIKSLAKFFFNGAVAADVYRKLVFKNDSEAETYILDMKKEIL